MRDHAWRWILRHPETAPRLPLVGPKLRALTAFERFIWGSILALDPFSTSTEDFRALLTFALGPEYAADVDRLLASSGPGAPPSCSLARG